MSEDAKKVVRDCWAAASSGKIAAVAEFYAPDAVYYGSGGEPVRGRDNIAAVIGTYLTAFPDMKMTIEDIFSESDRVFSRVTARGTNTGPLPNGHPATGKKVEMRWIMNVARISNGKIAEEWEILDLMDMLAQLGVVEAGTSAATVGRGGA